MVAKRKSKRKVNEVIAILENDNEIQPICISSCDSESFDKPLQEQCIWEEKENPTDIKYFSEIFGISLLCLHSRVFHC